MTHYLTKHAYFTNKFDLDQAASQHRGEHWQAMNHTDRTVLDIIRQYSVKFGAAHLKHDTIAERIGKSNITVRRAIRKLVQLNIIEKTHYVRPVMNGLGANIYAIKPFETQENFEEKNIKTAPVKRKITEEKVEEATPTTFYGRMKAFLASTIGDDKLARNFFGVYRQLTIPMLKFTIHAHQGPLFEILGMRAMHIAVRATKQKKIHHLPGYFSGVLRELIDEALFGDAFMDYTISPIQLEDYAR